jgi:hypothetical protein
MSASATRARARAHAATSASALGRQAHSARGFEAPATHAIRALSRARRRQWPCRER